LASFFPSFLYNVHYLHNYFINVQFRVNLGSAFGILESLGLVNIGLPIFIAFGLALVLAFFLVEGLTRLVQKRTDASGKRLRNVPYYLIVVALIVAIIDHWGKSLLFGLNFYGIAFNTLCVVSLILVSKFRHSERSAHFLSLCLLLFLGFILFFNFISNGLLKHAYYLYWFRYLYSEVYWMGVLLAGYAGAFLWKGVETRFPKMGQLWAYVVLFALSLSYLQLSSGLANRAIFDNSFEQIKWLNKTLEQEDLPIFFSGFDKDNGTQPKGWFFPNIYRSYGLPLKLSFRRNVDVPPQKAFDRDAIVKLDELAAKLASRSQQKAYLITVNRPNAPAHEENLWNQSGGERSGVSWTLLEERVDVVHLMPLKANELEPKVENIPIRLAVYEITLK
jgi:hypothetical protein